MTQEEQDVLVGRVIRESRVAEEELRQLLVKAEQVAADIGRLSREVSERVSRAKAVAAPDPVHVAHAPNARPTDAGIEFGRLTQYAAAVDLDAIDKLDREIGEAVANVMRFREQKRKLGVSNA